MGHLFHEWVNNFLVFYKVKKDEKTRKKVKKGKKVKKHEKT